MTQKAAFTYDEVAQQLSCEKRLVRQLVADGELIAFTISSKADARSKRVSSRELERFIQGREEAELSKFGGLGLATRQQASN